MIKLIKLVTFAIFIAVSSFLSINLFINLGSDTIEKIALVSVAVSLEGLKVYSIIMANRYLQAARRRKEDSQWFQLFRTGLVLYVLYGVVSFTSMAASLGYTLTVVDRVSEKSTTVSREAEVLNYQDTLKNLEEQLKQNNALIKTNQESIVSLPADYITRKNEIQKTIERLQGKNSEILTSKTDVTLKIQAIKTTELEGKQTQKRTMYQLIGDVLSIPEKWVMFILLGIISILIEMGIIATSSFENILDDSVHKKEPVEVTQIKEKRKYNKKIRNTIDTLLEKIEETPDEAFKEFETQSPDEIPKGVVKNLNDFSKTVKDMPPEAYKAVSENISELIEQETEVKATVIKETIPVREVPSDFERFIKTLFLNGNKPFLKDRDSVSDELGIPRDKGSTFFNTLLVTKGPTGYSFIEYRKDSQKYYPNYTSEVILDLLHKNNMLT
jgi:hypothetical protein